MNLSSPAIKYETARASRAIVAASGGADSAGGRRGVGRFYGPR